MITRKRHLSLSTTLLALAIGLLALPAVGQEEIDRTVDAEADGTVVVSNVSGTVTVTGWDREQVEITGTLGKGSERLDVIERNGRVIIKVILPRGRHDKRIKGSHLEIMVPAGSKLDVETVSADISVGDLEGALELESVSGEIVARGTVDEAELESVSGDIECLLRTGRLVISSVSGDLDIEGARGLVAASTVSGSAGLAGDDFDRLDFESVSGDLVFSGELNADGDFQFSSHSGDITLLLGGDVDAEFEVSTFSGDIENDFGGQARRTGKYAPGREMSFTAGDGSASVEIETFSGDVRIGDR